MAINGCPECLKKQQQIDRLQEEVVSLRGKLYQQRRKEQEGVFGSSTPSSKIPVKPNRGLDEPRKPRGARPGHPGVGRRGITAADADLVIDVPSTDGCRCPGCGGPLQDKGLEERGVIDSRPVKALQVVYRLPRKYCPHCRTVIRTPAPGVLPKSLYGNQLIVTAAVMHYLHGIPMGRVCEQTGMEPGSLVEIFHRLARLCVAVPERLTLAYRASAVKHADETGWRTDGKNGYAWLFATDRLSLFLFRKTRSGEIARQVLGTKPLSGTLVVDRYAGYNKVPCAIQYCYAHLLREVQDLEKEFPDAPEVIAFVSTLAPLLSLAMGLRTQSITDDVFFQTAQDVKAQIVAAVEAPARHLGIRHIQDIFRNNAHRLYHWATDRRIPADNNRAERDLRPTVIARKVSFGSQSDAGAHTRSVLMSVLTTLKKQHSDPAARLKETLDLLAHNINQDPFPLLFPELSSG